MAAHGTVFGRGGPNGDVHVLTGAYALDAVDDLERAAVERHVAGCATCAAEVAELRATAAQLGEAVAEPAPPALRERVLAQARETAQLPPGRRSEALPAAATLRWRRWTAAAAVASVLALGAAAGTYAVQQARVGAAENRADAARAAAAQAEAESAADRARVATVLAAPDARVRTGSVPGGGSLALVTSATLDQSVAVLTELPAVASGRTYQLWLITAGTPRSAGVLPPGRRSATALLSQVTGADALAMTVEPVAGSARPTTPPVMQLPLA